MHIGIDGNEANISKRVGSNVYSYQLLKWINNLNQNDLCTVYLKSLPETDLPAITSNWKYRILKPGLFWTRWRLPLELSMTNSKPNVFFTPGHYAPGWCHSPLAISIMDLSYLHFPEMFKPQDLYKLKNWTENSIKRASHIFTISEFNKTEIIKKYGIDKNTISVTYPGIDHQFLEKQISEADTDKIKRKYNIHGNYLIYLGTLQPRKNLVRMINAYSKLQEMNVQLVIAGKKGWYFEEIFEQVVELELQDKVIFTDFLDEYEKIALIRAAKCLVLVSLYEGFGIPVAEAMACGVPVVVSNSTSLKEIADNVGIYVDPEDVKSITRGIQEAIQLNDVKRKELAVKSIKKVEQFSWEQAAAKTLEVLHDIAI